MRRRDEAANQGAAAPPTRSRRAEPRRRPQAAPSDVAPQRLGLCSPRVELCPAHALAARSQVDDEGNIVDSCFKTFGCGSAIASSSVATEWVKGRHIDGAATIKNSDIAKHLSLPPVKLHCSMLAEDAIKAAVKDVKAKRAAAKATEGGRVAASA